MKKTKKYLIAALLVLLAFAVFYIWGWSPYSGFLFSILIFIAGTSTLPPKKKEKTAATDILEAARMIAALAALCVAAWLSGEETFSRVIKNPVFLVLCCAWAELTIAQRYQQRKIQ